MPPKQTSARKNTTLENLKRATEASRRLQQTAAKKRKKRPDGGAPRSADAAAASKHPPKPVQHCTVCGNVRGNTVYKTDKLHDFIAAHFYNCAT
ncbi:hypothetical protein DIPPA_07650 [Diplonema papillatum]|nr:hypothetical protein DIPPA_07632 [Diplonema papillatum]KAJ9460259.1 hypothetical protein DIPPA_07650 [Diplonema papillatum]